MNGQAQTVILNCDWLALSLRLMGDVRPVAGYMWREYSATNIWAKRRVLWTDEGQRVLTLLSEPRSAIIGSKCALLEIDNEWLYHGGGHRRILDVLASSVSFEVTGISRLDLCVDFNPNPAQRAIMLGLASGEYYVGGKRHGSMFWSSSDSKFLHDLWRGRSIPHCMSWGHKTSAIRWKLYYKTKELADAGGNVFMMKPYIVDQWRIHGLDVSNVWRLEVSMHKLNGYTLRGSPLTLENVEENVVDLFLMLYESRFDVKLNEGHKDRTNDKSVQFLPLNEIYYTMRRADSKGERERHGRITLLRHLVRSLDDEAVLLDAPTRADVLTHIGHIVDRDRLQNYFYSMTGLWYADFCDKVNADAEGADDSAGHDARPLFGDVNADIRPNTGFEEYDSNGTIVPNPDTAAAYHASLAEKVANLQREIDRSKRSDGQLSLSLLP